MTRAAHDGRSCPVEIGLEIACGALLCRASVFSSIANCAPRAPKTDESLRKLPAAPCGTLRHPAAPCGTQRHPAAPSGITRCAHADDLSVVELRAATGRSAAAIWDRTHSSGGEITWEIAGRSMGRSFGWRRKVLRARSSHMCTTSPLSPSPRQSAKDAPSNHDAHAWGASTIHTSAPMSGDSGQHQRAHGSVVGRWSSLGP